MRLYCENPVEMAKSKLEMDEADMEAVEEKRIWAFDALMSASKKLEQVRKETATLAQNDLRSYRVRQFECNLTDAARAYAKAWNRMVRVGNKVDRAAKALGALREKGLGDVAEPNRPQVI